MKNLLYLSLGLLVSPFVFSQLVTVSSGSTVHIASGTSVTLGGLEIEPANTYVVTGANAVSRTSTPMTSGENSSINRVFTTSATLSGFVGTLTFHYLDGELNDITESELVLELQADDDTWTSYEGTVDELNNTISYTFSEAVSFKAVTASAAGATLTIQEIASEPSSIVVYPNPTANRIYIQTQQSIHAELYDVMGRKVRSTNQNEIDVSSLTNGTYILNVTTKDNSATSFMIIKQ